MLEKLKNLVEELKAGLPTQSRLVLSESIDPTRALILREVCLFRITELAESAYDAFKKDNLITAFILSRAIMETASLFWSFLNEIEKALTTKDIEEIRNFLSSVLTGARASLAKELGRTLPSPHILKLIKNMDKIIPHYYDHYELLCEFTHPNAAGLNESYAKIDYDQNKVFFGFNVNRERVHANLALPPLVGLIEAFIMRYDASSQLWNEFIDVCEEVIKKQEILKEPAFVENIE